MATDGGAGGAADDLGAAVERLFADAWQAAATGDDRRGWLEDDRGLDVTDGQVDDLETGLVAVRSASAVAERQLLVRGGWADVALDVTRSGDHVDVRGTVLGVEEPCSVQLLDAGDEVALDVADALGEFTLLGLVPGRYELVVAARHAELHAELDVT